MRKIVTLDKPKHSVIRLMIYQSDEGVYLFRYGQLADCGGLWDQWYDSEENVMMECLDEYGVSVSDWQQIDDPEPHCQHDWIAPVRVKGRNLGKPQFGTLEQLIYGEWVTMVVNHKR